MKKVKENLESVCVFKDEAFELKTRADLEAARNSLQDCLDSWSELKLTPCIDLVSLIQDPKKAFRSAVYQLSEVPETTGRFKINKDAYIASLEIPTPDKLYKTAQIAMGRQYAYEPEFWSIIDDRVVLNKLEAETLINSQSVYATGDKIELIKDLTKLVELLNSTNSRLNMAGMEIFNTSSPVTYKFLYQWCVFSGGDVRGGGKKILLSPEFIKRLIALQDPLSQMLD